MSHADIDTSWVVPEADRAEQQTPATPETEDETSIPEAFALDRADEADVLEQASPLPLDEDDYRGQDTADQLT